LCPLRSCLCFFFFEFGGFLLRFLIISQLGRRHLLFLSIRLFFQLRSLLLAKKSSLPLRHLVSRPLLLSKKNLPLYLLLFPILFFSFYPNFPLILLSAICGSFCTKEFLPSPKFTLRSPFPFLRRHVGQFLSPFQGEIALLLSLSLLTPPDPPFRSQFVFGDVMSFSLAEENLASFLFLQ